MHAPQQFKLFAILHAPQPSDQTAILAIRTNEEPRRLPARTARSEKHQNVWMSEALPYVDFAREDFAGSRGGEDFDSDGAFSPGTLIHCGEVPNADLADFLFQVNFESANSSLTLKITKRTDKRAPIS
jgi:hypothetical protein